MLQEELNPRDREWPENELDIGEIVEEQFFECESGPKVLTLVNYDDSHYLVVQDCRVRNGEVQFRHSAWLKVEDGTARLALRIAHQMMRDLRQ
jgi:hypothetical protein